MNTIEQVESKINVTDIDGTRWYLKGDQKYISVTEVISVPKAYKLQNYYKKNSANKIQKTMETTADFGSQLHKLVEFDLKGIKVTIDNPALAKCFDNWLKVKENHKISAIETEKAVVSDLYGFGGRLDILGMIDGALCVIDLKSGFFDNLVGLQLAAYRQGLIEAGYYHDIGLRGLQIHRDGREPTIFPFTHLDWCIEHFLDSLETWKHLNFTKLDSMQWPHLKQHALKQYFSSDKGQEIVPELSLG